MPRCCGPFAFVPALRAFTVPSHREMYKRRRKEAGEPSVAFVRRVRRWQGPAFRLEKRCERHLMYWIYDYPHWATAILFIAGFVAAACSGVLFLRPKIHAWLHREPYTNEMIGLPRVLLRALCLLLGLLAVTTYQNYAAVTDTIDKEASSIAALHRDFGAFPEPVRGQLQDRLREYVRFTIEEGWSQQRHGVAPIGGTGCIDALFDVLAAFEPGKKARKSFTPKRCTCPCSKI